MPRWIVPVVASMALCFGLASTAEAQATWRLSKKASQEIQECIKRCEENLISQGFSRDHPGFLPRFQRCKRACKIP